MMGTMASARDLGKCEQEKSASAFTLGRHGREVHLGSAIKLIADTKDLDTIRASREENAHACRKKKEYQSRQRLKPE